MTNFLSHHNFLLLLLFFSPLSSISTIIFHTITITITSHPKTSLILILSFPHTKTISRITTIFSLFIISFFGPSLLSHNLFHKHSHIPYSLNLSFLSIFPNISFFLYPHTSTLIFSQHIITLSLLHSLSLPLLLASVYE